MKQFITLLTVALLVMSCKQDEDTIQPTPVTAQSLLTRMYFNPVASGSQNSGTRFIIPVTGTTLTEIRLMRRDTLLDIKSNVTTTVDLYDTVMKKFPLHDSAYTFKVKIGSEVTEATFKMP